MQALLAVYACGLSFRTGVCKVKRERIRQIWIGLHLSFPSFLCTQMLSDSPPPAYSPHADGKPPPITIPDKKITSAPARQDFSASSSSLPPGPDFYHQRRALWLKTNTDKTRERSASPTHSPSRVRLQSMLNSPDYLTDDLIWKNGLAKVSQVCVINRYIQHGTRISDVRFDLCRGY